MHYQGNLAFSLALDIITAEGLTCDIEASPEECQLLSERFSLLGVAGLKGQARIIRRASDGAFLLKGTINAKICQRCVVSLDPVNEVVEGDFELLLVDEETASAWDDDELYLDPDYPDYDALNGDQLAIGEILAQTLSIQMNPYPRKDGIDLTAPIAAVERDFDAPHPFAALSAIRDKS